MVHLIEQVVCPDLFDGVAVMLDLLDDEWQVASGVPSSLAILATTARAISQQLGLAREARAAGRRQLCLGRGCRRRRAHYLRQLEESRRLHPAH